MISYTSPEHLVCSAFVHTVEFSCVKATLISFLLEHNPFTNVYGTLYSTELKVDADDIHVVWPNSQLDVNILKVVVYLFNYLCNIHLVMEVLNRQYTCMKKLQNIVWEYTFFVCVQH